MILSILYIYLSQPWYLLLLLIISLLVIHYIYKRKSSSPDIGYSSSAGIENVPVTFRQRLIHLPFIIRMLLLALLIFIISRPQTSIDKSDIKVEGIDILISLDISGSMLAEDFKPNRLEASKEASDLFAAERKVQIKLYAGSKEYQSSTIVNIEAGKTESVECSLNNNSQVQAVLLDAVTQEQLDKVTIKKSNLRDLGGL